MYNYHVHSRYSLDSEMGLEEACEKALQLGIKEIAFTDHVEFDYPSDGDILFDYNDYSQRIEELRDKYQGQLYILKGVEIGYQTHISDRNTRFTTLNGFDFIISSVHTINNLSVINGDFFKSLPRKKAFKMYLEKIKEMVVNFSNFNVVGHLDVAKRYTGYGRRDLEYEEFPKILDEILKSLIDLGKGIEINTSAKRHGINGFYPSFSIIKRYYELGGEIITVGSDAHSLDDIGQYLDKGYKVLKEAGFKHVSIFRKGKHLNVNLP